MSFNFSLSGVAALLKLGKGGNQLKSETGFISARNPTDESLVRFKIGSGTANDDAVTKLQLDTAVVGALVYKGTFDASAGNYTALTGAIKGDFYKISVGGTIDSRVWAIGDDLIINTSVTGAPTNTEIDKIDNAATVTGGVNVKTVAITHADSTVNIGTILPSTATILRVLINVTAVFDGTTPTLSIGKSGAVAELMATTEIDLKTVAVYVNNVRTYYSSATQLLATLVSDSSTTGEATLLVEYV
jgi:hypothetical protein